MTLGVCCVDIDNVGMIILALPLAHTSLPALSTHTHTRQRQARLLILYLICVHAADISLFALFSILNENSACVEQCLRPVLHFSLQPTTVDDTYLQAGFILDVSIPFSI